MTDETEKHDTTDSSYTERLIQLEQHWLKTALKPVNPYRWNIRRLAKGRTLDVGCGIGRNLRYLNRKDVVGVDHNIDSVSYVRGLGYPAFVPDEFHRKFSGRNDFETILISHVLEHLDVPSATEVVRSYLPYLASNGKVIVICPQELGYESDPTHVTYFTGQRLSVMLTELGLRIERVRSFPLPKLFGQKFIYNEHVVVATK